MKHKQLLPMKLQFFAENPEGSEPAEPNTPEFNLDGLNEEQLAAIKEKYSFKDDKDVDSIIKSKHSRWQKEAEEQRNEAARLAKLSEEERQQALIQKEKDDFEKEKAVFRKERLLVEKGNRLDELGIPRQLATRIGGDTAEEALEDVKAFKAEWDKAIQLAVDKALAGSVDKPLGTNSIVPKVDGSTMSYEDLLKLKQTNPKAYEQAFN